MKIIELGAETVKRDRRGVIRHARDERPRVFSRCEKCMGDGKVNNPETGRQNKCRNCQGTGWRGEFYTRMTTFIDCLEDKTNLFQWKQRVVLHGVALDLTYGDGALMDEFMGLNDPMGEGKRDTNKLVEKFEKVADADLKALAGDGLHDIYEQINNGVEPSFVPPEYEADVAAYREALRQAGVDPVATETFVVNDRYKAAGSFDMLVIHDGRLKIADIKTGRIDYGFGKIGMQLGGYAQSVKYDPYTHERTPITYQGLQVDQNSALIIHAPAGDGCVSVVPVDIGAASVGLELAWEVRGWRKRKWDRSPLVTVSI